MLIPTGSTRATSFNLTNLAAIAAPMAMPMATTPLRLAGMLISLLCKAIGTQATSNKRKVAPAPQNTLPPNNANLHLLANVAQLPAAQNVNPLDFLANIIALQPPLPVPAPPQLIPQAAQPPQAVRVSARNRAPRAYNGNDPYRRVYPGGNG